MSQDKESAACTVCGGTAEKPKYTGTHRHGMSMINCTCDETLCTAPIHQAVPAVARPIPLLLSCPRCGAMHVDEGEWATKPHKTHQCQSCQHEWRPFNVPTVGVMDGPEAVKKYAEEYASSLSQQLSDKDAVIAAWESAFPATRWKIEPDEAKHVLDAKYVPKGVLRAKEAELGRVTSERDALKEQLDVTRRTLENTFNVEELHYKAGSLDARIETNKTMLAIFAEGFVDYFKDSGGKNFVVVGFTHKTEGSFEIVIRKQFSESPELVAGKAVARAEAAEAQLSDAQGKWIKVSPESMPEEGESVDLIAIDRINGGLSCRRIAVRRGDYLETPMPGCLYAIHISDAEFYRTLPAPPEETK